MNIKLNCKIASASFAILFFAVFGILSLITPDREYSEDENRYLAQKPDFNAKTVINGDFQTEFEDYVNDQMVYRENFMGLYALEQKLLMKSEYNGVYVTKGDRLIEKYNEPENTVSIAERFKKLNDKTNAECLLMLVPTAVSIYPEELPYKASEQNRQKEVMDYIYQNSGMTTIDVFSTMQEAKKYCKPYYLTDHHWTTDGAYAAYQKFCESRKITAQRPEDFTIETKSYDFYGTVYSKALTLNQKADEMKFYLQDMDGISVKYRNGEGSLYNFDYLEKKDKYAAFLNGIQPEITIENSNLPDGKTLLVVKDSYANCFVPFLINHYKTIVVLDTRYFRTGVSSKAEEIGADEILLLFNLNTLDTDSALAGIF